MSLSRQLLREFRPFFRMLEDPFSRSPALLSRNGAPSVFNDPFFRDVFPTSSASLPAVDVSEEPNAYVVEAELPGVKKENVDVRIGDGGQSLTIEGRTYVRSSNNAPEVQTSEGTEVRATATPEASTGTLHFSPPLIQPILTVHLADSQALTQTSPQSTQLTTERSFSSASQFSRTVWLPRRGDGSGVTAKLADGILTVRIPKVEEQEGVKVNIE